MTPRPRRPGAAGLPPQPAPGQLHRHQSLPVARGCDTLSQVGRGLKGPIESGREGAERDTGWVRAPVELSPEGHCAKTDRPSTWPNRKFILGKTPRTKIGKVGREGRSGRQKDPLPSKSQTWSRRDQLPRQLGSCTALSPPGRECWSPLGSGKPRGISGTRTAVSREAGGQRWAGSGALSSQTHGKGSQLSPQTQRPPLGETRPRAPPRAAPRRKLLTWGRGLRSQLLLGRFLGLARLLGRPVLGRARLPLLLPVPRGQRRREGLRLGLGVRARVVGFPAPDRSKLVRVLKFFYYADERGNEEKA